MTELDSLDILHADRKGSRPHLIVGDIVEIKNGKIGVIAEATVTVDASSYVWNQDIPKLKNHGCMPAYAIDFIGDRGNEKRAWWEASEFKQVVALGPARRYINTKEGQGEML